jgi:hypothetical protein
MSSVKKIAVVGDGPIGNIVIAKLLIEHHRNNNNKNNIEITHYTSERVSEKGGYKRRHILFITEELVAELEDHVLECEKCLTKISNEQKLDESSNGVDGIKLLFSTRLLENIFAKYLSANKNKFCTAPKCNFIIQISREATTYYDYNYVFFAIGTNSGIVRKEYFYDEYTPVENTIKIIAPESEPIVVFYAHLGPNEINNDIDAMTIKDRQSKIEILDKIKLGEAGIDLNELDIFVNIIYAFYQNIQAFINSIKPTEISNSRDFQEWFEKILIFFNKNYKSNNLSLDGYNNFTDYIQKFINAINMLKTLFKPNNNGQDNEIVLTAKTELFNLYMNFLRKKTLRSHQITDEVVEYYKTLINSPNDETGISVLILQNYSNLLYNLLHKYNPDECPMSDKGKCVIQTFLVNVVTQSLNCYGIINNNKLVYASKKETSNFFMIGDMANAYSAGISVEIGLRFVNYIIPIFYNFYINEDKQELNCDSLYIDYILDDLLSEKYRKLLDKNINNGTDDTNTTLRELIVNIKNNYKTNLSTLCDDYDIFLTYYNIVCLIQYIKNVDLIIDKNEIIAISNKLRPRNKNRYNYKNPYNYKIINNYIEGNNNIEVFRK